MAKQLHCIVHHEEQDQYYAIGGDGVLALYRNGQREPLKEYRAASRLLVYEGYEEVREVDETGEEKTIQRKKSDIPYENAYTMELLWPWLSVFQQYGTNGCVYHLETEEIREFSRENYHAEVSSFSNGFLIRCGQVCLLHQSQWNRLDITNLESGELLTDREIYCRLRQDTDGLDEGRYEQKNYVDYFHGKIFFSPDYQYFVDTGWVWQPVGVTKLYRTEDFITKYEASEIGLRAGEDWIYGDDWDQSAVWLDENTFLLNFFPDLELVEEDHLFSGGRQGVLLQFQTDHIAPTKKTIDLEELQVDKVIPFPFVPTPVHSYRSTLGKEVKTRYYAGMLNVSLYWDGEEQLLIGINANELLVLDKERGVSYCMRYGAGQCFYSAALHQVYQLPSWPGNFDYAPIRELLKAARAFRLETEGMD